MESDESQAVRQRLIDDLGEVYGGRRFLLAVDMVQGFRGMHDELVRLGGQTAFVMASRVGTGPVPETPWHSLGLAPAADIVEAIHSSERALADVPPDVRALVDAVDPAGALSTLAAFFSAGAPVAGRRQFGARPASWQALEDKTVIDALWDAAGVPRAPSEVVPCERMALQAAAGRIDAGDGTVWAGDAREGFHGGGVRTLWVRAPGDAERAFARLQAHHDTVRVMPFLEGLPCSIHGLVLPDGVAVFRPAEMLVLRGPEGFAYARAATLWDPPTVEREGMRACARRVGAHLATTHGYRGAFTMDGVMTAEGFRPTELNPRVGAAMGMLSPPGAPGPQVPFTLLHYALIEGFRPSMAAQELEDAIVGLADAHRTGSFGFSVPGSRTETVRFGLRWTGHGWERCAEDAGEVAAMAGPGATGDFVNARLRPEAPEALGWVGRSLAPAVAAFAAWSDRHLGMGIGPLQPAPDLHAGEE